MDIPLEPVCGRADRDHRLQCRGLQKGGLQAVEPAPALAHHPHRPRTPGLCRKPGNHVTGIGKLLRGIFVRHQTFAVPGPAHIDTHTGIAMARDIGMHLLIARQGAIALAVRDIFQNGRHRVCRGILRHPDPGRQAAAIGHDDTHVGKIHHTVAKAGYGLHRVSPWGLPIWARVPGQIWLGMRHLAAKTDMAAAPCRPLRRGVRESGSAGYRPLSTGRPQRATPPCLPAASTSPIGQSRLRRARWTSARISSSSWWTN